MQGNRIMNTGVFVSAAIATVIACIAYYVFVYLTRLDPGVSQAVSGNIACNLMLGISLAYPLGYSNLWENMSFFTKAKVILLWLAPAILGLGALLVSIQEALEKGGAFKTVLILLLSYGALATIIKKSLREQETINFQ